MSTKEVSVIIPVYNSEKYLKRCLDSVVNQTLENFEIIIVNDGSSDNSLNILNEYKQKYSQIILLNQNNKGQAVARNRALDIAKGEYISFVDSDDFIENNMLELMYKEAVASNVDMVICNWDRVDSVGRVLSTKNHIEYQNQILNQYETIREFFLNKNELIEGFSWNKIIRKSLFNQVRYLNMKYEDIPTMFQILTRISKCKYINHTLYHYVQHNSSTVHSKTEENVLFFIKAVKMVRAILEKENLLTAFEHEYYVYSSNKFLSEYSASRDLIDSSVILSQTFENLLKSITLRKCMAKKHFNTTLVLKVILFKIGLLQIMFDLKHTNSLIERN